MQWEATDQFGNLYVGNSDAESVEALRPHLAMLVDELRARAGDAFRITVDFDYQEVSGPDPDSVSHILSVPWLADAPREETLDGVCEVVGEICAEKGLSGVAVGAA